MTNKIILSIQYLWVILHNYFIIRNCSSRGPVVENDVKCRKIDPKLQNMVFLGFSERCHGNMCNLNVIVVLEFISRDLYLLFEEIVKKFSELQHVCHNVVKREKMVH